VLAPVCRFLEALALAGEGAPGAVDAAPGGRVDEQAIGERGEPVAGGAVDRPVFGHALMARDDLLDQHVQGARRSRALRLQCGAAAPRMPGLQSLEVLLRVE